MKAKKKKWQRLWILQLNQFTFQNILMTSILYVHSAWPYTYCKNGLWNIRFNQRVEFWGTAVPPRSEADRRGALRLGRARGPRRCCCRCSLRTSAGNVLLHHIGAEMSWSMPTFSQRAENVLDLSPVAFDNLSCRGVGGSGMLPDPATKTSSWQHCVSDPAALQRRYRNLKGRKKKKESLKALTLKHR